MTTKETVATVESTEEKSLESVTDAVKEGVADATKTVNTVLPAIGKVVSKTVYNGCYYISFGVTFSALTVGKLLPIDNVVGRGLHDGAEAAKDTITRRAEEVAEVETKAIESTSEQTEAAAST